MKLQMLITCFTMLSLFANGTNPPIDYPNQTYITSKGDEIIVVVSKPYSSLVEAYYTLQGAKGLAVSVTNAQISYNKEYMVIRLQNNESIVLSLTENGGYKSALKQNETPKLFFGYGLARGVVKEDVNFEDVVRHLETTPSTSSNGGDGNGSTTGDPIFVCQAGGCGSSSCSMKGSISVLGSGVDVECSVSCNSPYVACCSSIDVSPCKCVKKNCD